MDNSNSAPGLMDGVAKKVQLDDLTKDDLVKKCTSLLAIVQKAKQAKDQLLAENDDLRQQQKTNAVSEEIIASLTDQKLEYVSTIDDLKRRLQTALVSKQDVENENESNQRQMQRLTSENDQLITELDAFEKRINELKEIGLEQQRQLLAVEQDRNSRIAEIDHLRNTNCEDEKYREKLHFLHEKLVKLAAVVTHIKHDKEHILDGFQSYINQVGEWKTQLNATVQQLDVYIGAIQKENQQLKETVSKLNEQLKAHKTDDEKSKEYEQYESLKTHCNELEQENVTVRDLNSRNEQEICDLKEHLEQCRQLEQKANEELIKLVQQNERTEKDLTEARLKPPSSAIETQTSSQLIDEKSPEEIIQQLRRENAEVLLEMNEMNQVLKERGETISQQQVHCEEMLKKLQIHESQANKNSETLTEKDHELEALQREIHDLKQQLKDDSDSLSTMSRNEDLNRLRDLDSSWEERYGKLRTFAVKLKAKINELTENLNRVQMERATFYEKFVNSTKSITGLQQQLDQRDDELESVKKQMQSTRQLLEHSRLELNQNRSDNDDKTSMIKALNIQLAELNKERKDVANWKKEIGNKVQILRKELELERGSKTALEGSNVELKSQLDAKEKQLKCDQEALVSLRGQLDQVQGERKKQSVLDLEIEDYERNAKDLSMKLTKKQEEIVELTVQLENQKSIHEALREQNRVIEERVGTTSKQLNVAITEVVSYKKKCNDLEMVSLGKDDVVHHLNQQLERARTETEDLSMELSKTIGEHQKTTDSVRDERDTLRNQVVGMQQALRETQNSLRLKNEELTAIRDNYDSYKMRAQSVLRQNQHRDVVVEEQMHDDLKAFKQKVEQLSATVEEYKSELNVAHEEMCRIKEELHQKCIELDETASNLNLLNGVHEDLVKKHKLSVLEHNEAVRVLKVHSETLAQCYRQQLTDQESRYLREIHDLQSKIEKTNNSPSLGVTYEYLQANMLSVREEGEGSESVDTDPYNGGTNSISTRSHLNHPSSNNNNSSTSIVNVSTPVMTNNLHPVPLERLLSAGGATGGQHEYHALRKQLNEHESKVQHLTSLLSDTEQDLAKHVQMNKLLKDEIRRQQRSEEREKHAENLEYLKNVVFKFVTLHSGDERYRLVPVLNTILKLSPEECKKLTNVAKGDAGLKEWATSYLPGWS